MSAPSSSSSSSSGHKKRPSGDSSSSSSAASTPSSTSSSTSRSKVTKFIPFIRRSPLCNTVPRKSYTGLELYREDPNILLLSGKKSSEWSEEDIEIACKAFSKVVTLHLRSKEPLSIEERKIGSQVAAIQGEWCNILESRPDVFDYVDPWTVLFGFGGAGVAAAAPAGWAASIVAYGATNRGALAVVDGTDFIYECVSREEAFAFAGFMMGSHPGIASWVYNTGAGGSTLF